MILVDDMHARVIDDALASARHGHPTVVVIEGEPGAGKSTLLGHIAARAEDYQTRTTEGDDIENRSPFRTIEGWGVTIARGADGAHPSPFVVAQHLRDLVDDLSTGGPVLLQVDDLQWADPESVQALTWLLERVAGDRLLVVAGTRPLSPRDHDGWQKFVASSSAVRRLQLSGLSLELATELAKQVHPGISPDVAAYLWEHTGGNPLYLTSLLREHDLTSLSRMRVLPAPAEFARTLTARVDDLDDDPVRLLRAAAVLGPGWLALPDVASVADVAHPTDAVAVLAEHELLLQRATNPGLSVRLPHALVRAGLYQDIPAPERRLLHLRAAEVVSDLSSSLEHRLAAAEHYDDALADELEEYARDQHADREHRSAAQHLRWASRVTSDAGLRNQRWLDALFESALAGDLALVHDELPDVSRTRDKARRALISGAVEALENRWLDASRTLARGEGVDTDPLTRYRLDVLLAWCRLGAGGTTAEIARALDSATQQPQRDASLSGYYDFVAGQLAGRLGGADAMGQTLGALPAVAAGTPADLSYLLAWRGAVFVRRGFHEGAAADFVEVVRRIQNGLPDISDGLFEIMLGYAHLMGGQVGLADARVRVALQGSRNPGNPLLQTLASTVPSALGDFERADQHLDAATDWLRVMPWDEALESHLIAQVVRLHAGDDPPQQEQFVARTRSTFGGAALDPEGSRSPLWLSHLALAHTWAGERERADELLEELAGVPFAPDWVPSAGAWLRGVVAEKRGRDDAALALLDEAVTTWPASLPLYRAHAHVTRARLADRLGKSAVAADSRQQARGVYEQCGATGYLALLGAAGDAASTPDTPVAFAMLSERERDVLALLASGFSYVQIARDLYISRSTVGFHLSNIYAKTGTASRHELTALVRAGG